MAQSTIAWLYGIVEAFFVIAFLFPLISSQRATPKTKTKSKTIEGRPSEHGSGIAAVHFDLKARQSMLVTMRGIFPGRKTANGWDPKRDMPSLAGKVAIITGGNAGIGFETARGLLRGGARVYIASRAHERSKKAIAQLRAEIKAQGSKSAQVELLPCDLLDLSSVARAANDFLRREKSLHILVCNAGIAGSPRHLRSAQGYEQTFATNVLGHHLLVQRLVDVLAKTAAESKESTRVCTVSSLAHNFHHPLGFDPSDPEWNGATPLALGFGGKFINLRFSQGGNVYPMLHYGHSKFLNVVQTKAYHRRYGKQGIVFTDVDPGTNATEIVRDRTRFVQLIVKYFLPLLAFQPSQGAISQLWATTSPEGARLGGQHIMPWARVVPAAGLSNDEAMQDAFYDWCEEQRVKHGL